MGTYDRRGFLADVGRGMLIGSVGTTLAVDLGLAPVWGAEEAEDRLDFGKLEPLVAQMQQTPADRIVPAMIARLGEGYDLETLTAAAALANARTFGGEDYVGYHSFMALAPALAMSREMPSELAPLPVLKVVHRNTNRMQEKGGRKSEVLRPVAPVTDLSVDEHPLRAATRAADAERGERILAKQLANPGEAYNHLQFSVRDEVNVHRVVLSWRAWETLDIVGREHALTLLRQSVRFCVNDERSVKKSGNEPEIRRVLPRLMEEHGLLAREAGREQRGDGWVERTSREIYAANRTAAAELVAAALAEGVDPETVGEAISLAACRLVLHDPGRTGKQVSEDKPEGSVHGASPGVHASDAANAWRHIARVGDHRNRMASLVVAAYHTAGQSGGQSAEAFPKREHHDSIRAKDGAALLQVAGIAIRNGDQATAAAAVQRYGESNPNEPGPVFALLLGFATSEDGALHAEKYFRTVREEFAATRPAHRWQHVVALARVTASEHGRTAPGYRQARELLGLA